MVILPDEYQEVEYIQGRIVYNPAYIDTLYIPTVNTKLRVKFSPDNTNQYGFFGTRSDPYRYYCASFSSGARISCGLTVDRWPSKQITISYGSVYDCTIANGQSEINGEIIGTPIISADNWSDSVGTIQLWSRQNSSQYTADATAKYYLCQIWEINTLVHDFIPCYRKSDSVAGMYDLVSRMFYTNAGTGAFTVGPKIHKETGKLELITNLLMAQPHQETVAGTNGVATFDTDFEGVMKVSVPFSLVQDLHGMPNPYPAGASVNLIPDGTDTENGYVDGQYLLDDGTTVENANLYISEYILLDAETTYTWSNRINTSINPAICFYDENKEFISGIKINSQYSHTFVPPEGAVCCRSSQTKYSYQKSTPSGAAYQLEVGSTASEYRRYSNICPIEGRAEAAIGNANTAITFETQYSFTETQPGTGTVSPDNIRPIYPGLSFIRDNETTLDVYRGNIVVHKDGTSTVTETVHGYHILSSQWGWRSSSEMFWIECSALSPRPSPSNGNIRCDTYRIGSYTDRHSNTPQIFMTTIQSHSWLGATINGHSSSPRPQDLNITALLVTPITYQLSVSETRRALIALGLLNKYETVPITFTDPSTGDPMTIYGGTLTLNEDGSVDVTARWALLDMSNYGISAQVTGTTKKSFNIRVGGSGGSYYKAASKAICSDFPFKGYASWSSFQNPDSMDYGMWLYWAADNILYFVTDKDYVVNSKVAVELKESLIKTYHFDNIGQLKSFLGQNNVWTDLNGNPTVGYWKHG